MVPARLNRRERVDPAIGYLLCGVIDLGYVTPGAKPVATVCYEIDLELCDSWRKASRYGLLRD
jgi:hypothetical protein